MEKALKIGTVNHIQENSTIYKEGQLLQSVALILKGTVNIYNAGCRMTLGPGNFIGINDLYIGKYSFTCETNEACSLFIFKGRGMSDLGEIASLNKDYNGYMIKSLNRMISHLYDNFYVLKEFANDIYLKTQDIVLKYQQLVLGYGGQVRQLNPFQKLNAYEDNLPVKEEWIEGIKEMMHIPGEVMGTYYSYLPNKANRELEEKIKIITIVLEQLRQLVDYINEINHCLFNDSNDCVFKILCQEVMLLAPSHANYGDMTDLVDQSVELVNQIEGSYEEYAGRSISINRTMMEKIYFAMLSEKDVSGIMDMHDSLDEDNIEKELEDSLEQILSYGQIDPSLRTHFRELIDTFLEKRDKYQVSEEMRTLRKEIGADFYEIYKAVFMRAYRTKEYGKVIELFLHFGYVDERLITKDQAMELYRFNVNYQPTHYCNCYTMFEWLTLIYEGKKQPSRNDLDMDFTAYIRHLRAEGKITVDQEESYSKDQEKKLGFEINNMFALNMRLVNGKVTTFVPILHSDLLPLNMKKHYITFTRIDEAVRDVLKRDFSLFYRDVLYTNPGLGIPKEVVMKEYLPDVIVLPTCGVNGSMWQEVEGKLRESSGRFCIPIFHEASLYDTIIKLAGRYRWELCRTLQGMAWNDIKNKCLTSEYSDYLQFYRRNKELTEDKKEKVKQQIIKARNSSRECFVLDYEQWLKYESGGAIRLTKPVRDILAFYCPFSKDIRKTLVNRPVFSESLFRFEREAHSRSRILEAKALAITKKGQDVPKELAETISFYVDK